MTKLSLLLNLSATNWNGSTMAEFPRKTAAARRQWDKIYNLQLTFPSSLLQGTIVNLQTANTLEFSPKLQSLKLKFDSNISLQIKTGTPIMSSYFQMQKVYH